MKRAYTLFFVCALAVFFFAFPSRVSAVGSVSISKYDVQIEVNQDSTFDVTETITYLANGTFREIYRDITLNDPEDTRRCQNNPSLQCGGFSYIVLLEVRDGNDRLVDESDYYTTEVEMDDGSTAYEVAWTHSPNGRTFTNDEFTWSFKYRVYGGLGYFSSYDLFYWNAIYENRDYSADDISVTIGFPDDIEFETDNLQVLGGTYYYNYDYRDATNTLELTVDTILAYENFTILLKFPKDIVYEYATLDATLSPSAQNITIDDTTIDGFYTPFTGITPGTHNLKFEADGYYPYEETVDFAAGETVEMEVTLKATPGKILAIIAVVGANAFGCIGGVVLIGIFIWTAVVKGKDLGPKKSIAPWFHPPFGISPTIAGSVKDERVHLVDITAAIINAAVRGYIKIKETSKGKYTLIKLQEFVAGEPLDGRNVNYKALDDVEVRILSDIFISKTEVKNSDLQYKFYSKIPGIEEAVYSDVVNRGYFAQRPDKVRNKHIGIGVLMLFLGIGGAFLLSPLTLVTCGPALAIAGVVKMITGAFMPAKTVKGTELYQKCQGFRMYLATAERYRMQKLTPETFERFLPYAMVFGVEEEWAKNFENIYTEPPSWYVGYGAHSTFNSLYFAHAMTSMQSNYGRTMSSMPSSSGGGHSGGGWSGGGGFSGGFGGGGGGGGGGGMR